ncbi:hypothetical protein B296_00035497 [Ensete ventricosum]|uniref:Uncharacterized protein n=1 Tax=Ensete ventricosum TaxID=4639 RepID=A0A426WY69_ENSVE|nr:hypothetical protein B296_00035497 [Ensete ventricosum]
MPMSLSCYWRCCPCWGYERRLGLRAWLLSELWDVGDDCLEHSRYGLDLVGESLKSLRSYHQTPRLSGGGVSPGSLNKRQYRPGVWEDDLSDSRSQHDVVRPASARPAQ